MLHCILQILLLKGIPNISHTGFTVEEKYASSCESLKYQLFADVVLNCVDNFISKCVKEYSEAKLRM